MAFPAFDPSKHRRDLLGRFAASNGGPAVQRFRLGGVATMRTDRGQIREYLAEGHLGAGSVRRRRVESEARKAKLGLSQVSEAIRGVRPPRNRFERLGARRARDEGVRAAHFAARLYLGTTPAWARRRTTATKTSFTGKIIPIRDDLPRIGTRPTTYGIRRILNEPADPRVRRR